MGPGDLSRALAALPIKSDPRLLVGRETFDDAGVFRVSDDLALVQTVDFFAPIVDDPFDFGQIAAANALSDVYAMGGQPLTALNIVAFPTSDLPLEVLTGILAGGQDKVHEAGALIVGGHTVIDTELKYGLAVTGRAHPNFLLTNAARGPEISSFSPSRSATEFSRRRRSAGISPPRGAANARYDEGAQRKREPRGARMRRAVRHRHHGLRSAWPRVAHRAREQRHASRFTLASVPFSPACARRCGQGSTTDGLKRNAEYLKDLVRWQTAVEDDRAFCSVIRRLRAASSSPCRPDGSPTIFRGWIGATVIGEVIERGTIAIEVD